MAEREMLLDVTRLVWRLWRGGLPTGIDRVCLAYVERFGDHADAVVQRGGRYQIFGRRHSAALFDLFVTPPKDFRRAFVAFAMKAFPAARSSVAEGGRLYLNIGHTGLDEPSLPTWLARNTLRPVYLVHDLIPLTHPEYCRDGEGAKHARRMDTVLATASGVIGNSQATLDDLRDFAETRGRLMPPSTVAFIAGSAPAAEIVPAVMDRPHFITVGTIEGRKNHLLLLQLWKRLVEQMGPDAPLLLIVGQRGWEADHVFAMLDRSHDLRGHVRELGQCGDRDLADLIAGARALLMPSFAEGFGLPIIEALELGTPVIASDLPVYREFAGDLPKYIDPLDGTGWLSEIREFIGQSPERERQLRNLPAYRAPDWDSHFAAVEPWLVSL